MFAPDERWQPKLDWTTQAARALDRLIDFLPRDRDWTINVFRSAPLQMGIDATFLGAAVEKGILLPSHEALREAYETPDFRAELERLAQEPPEDPRGA
jgi:hypothetical protein